MGPGELRQRAEALLRRGRDPDPVEATRDDELIHELQVHQIELEMQNEELRRAQLEAEQASTRYFELFELAPVAYLTLGDKGTILQANRAAGELFGLRPEQLVGTKLPARLSRPDADALYLLCQSISVGAARKSIEVAIARPRQPVIARLDAIAAPRDHAPPGRAATRFRITLVDITAQREAEADLRRLLATLEERVRDRTLELEREVAARRRDQDALADKELFYRQTLASIPGMVFTTRADGYSDFVSPQWAEYTGQPPDQQLGDGWNQLLHPEDQSRTLAEWQAAVAAAAPYEVEYRVRRHDGVYQWFRARAQPIFDDQGQVVRWFGVATNIDQVKRGEVEREILVAFLRLVNQSRDTRRLAQQAVEFLSAVSGCEAAAIRIRQGDDYPSLAARGSAERFARDHGPIIPGEDDTPTARIPLRTGDHLLGLVELDDPRNKHLPPPVLALLDQLADALAVALSRHAAEAALRRSRADLALAQAVGQIGSWRLDYEQDVLSWSPECYRIFGLPAGSRVTYEGFLSCIHPADRDGVQRRWTAARRGEAFDLEHRIVVDGAIKWVREKGFLEGDPTDPGRSSFGIVQDITARKQTEQALRVKELKYRTLFENMHEEVQLWQVDREPDDRIACWRLVDANPAALAGWGLSSVEEVRGKTADEIFGAGSTERFRDMIEAAMSTGAPQTRESYLRQRDRYVRFSCVPLDDRFITTTTDITAIKKHEEAVEAESAAERARLEEGLRQAQKMEAVGRLAAGVSHDLGNLLMGIDGCADMALHTLDPGHPARAYLEQISSSVASGAATTRQLVAFSRARSGSKRTFDLGDCAARCQTLLHRLLGDNIALALDRDSAACPVYGEPAAFEQLLVNLTLNARHAMPAGGSLSIQVSGVSLAEPDLRGRSLLSAGDHVKLVIADTGSGMTEEVRRHAFEPFFTTRGDGGGTGLGLATAYATVQRAHGHIEIASEPGRGTRFEILLPRSPESIQPATPARPPEPDATRAPGAIAGRILLVEDDSLVRMSIREYLRRDGYQVLEATRADEAVA